MKWRRAMYADKENVNDNPKVVNDYKIFKAFYTNNDVQWIYKSDPQEKTQQTSVTQEIFFDLDYMNEYYQAYSFEQFEKDSKDGKIYFLEEDGRVISCVLLNLSSGVVTIDEWGVKKEILELKYDDFKIFIREIICLLEREKRFQNKLFRILPSNWAGRILKECGFKNERGGVFTKKSSS